MSDISVSSDGRDSLPGFQGKVAAGENGGAAAIWIANHLFQRDPITLAAMSLAQTKRMRVTLMAMSPLTVHPVQAVMAAATLDEFFPGRVTLCLGVGAPADLNSIGIGAERPLRIMGEALELARALLAGETVQVDGEFFHANGRQLFTGLRPVPLVLAASGPRMLELAGAAADGVLISAGASVEFVKRSLEHVHRGAKGRSVRTHAVVYAAVHEDETLAHDRLRRILAILLRGRHHAPNLDLGRYRVESVRIERCGSGRELGQRRNTDHQRYRSAPRGKWQARAGAKALRCVSGQRTGRDHRVRRTRRIATR